MNRKDQVLKWANRIRKEVFHKKPLKRLPRGYPMDGTACVIHNCFAVPWATDISVDRSETEIGCWGERIKHPAYITKFINDFDRGKYPELETK